MRIFTTEFVVAGPRTRCSVDVLLHAANTRGITFFLCFLSTDGSQSRFVVNEWAAGDVKGLAIIRNNHHHVWKHAVGRSSVFGAQAWAAKN